MALLWPRGVVFVREGPQKERSHRSDLYKMTASFSPSTILRHLFVEELPILTADAIPDQVGPTRPQVGPTDPQLPTPRPNFLRSF